MNAVIIGDGGWGTALALVLHNNGHRVSVWGPFEEYTRQVRTQRQNTKFLPDIPLPDDMLFTSDREEAVANADMVVIATPSRFYADVVGSFNGLITPRMHVVSVTKGLDKDSHERMTELAERLLERDVVAALSGPSHAEEVARNIPTAVVIASRDPNDAAFLQDAFNGGTFRVYTSDDVVGVELGGALKNVIAIAVGVSDGIGFGDNTRAALITRGLAEISRLGGAMGAQMETFAGLSGMGDLIVTCTSRLSRNRGVGERLGRGETIDDILGSMEQVAEGVWNAANAHALAARKGIEAPITHEVNALLYKGKDPREAVHSLLARDPRPERD
ncbi:MAG: NAD(P)-dependent glycerol-3-phosphate dehydrogenase [Spartobacteria bacterium]|nr:NAD(P)-dependent glycerol-3-phosphate dehydrogenase [Spartobacteria bacterium]